jgi:Transposase, Mutator family
MHTMTARKHKAERIGLKALVGKDREFLRELIQATLQEVLEAEMTEALAAAKSERTEGRNRLSPRTAIATGAVRPDATRATAPTGLPAPSSEAGESDASGRGNECKA